MAPGYLENVIQATFHAIHAITGLMPAPLWSRGWARRGGGIPLENCGKGHPDPNLIWVKPLMHLMMSEAAPDMGAASDGDDDRNMIVGRAIYVRPSDSLAVLATSAHLAPACRGGLTGIARSMPTSAAVDHVAAQLGIEAHGTAFGRDYYARYD